MIILFRVEKWIREVEMVNQRMIIPGFIRFIKKPEMEIFNKSLLRCLNTTFPSSLTFIFLKNRKKIPNTMSRILPAIPIGFSYTCRLRNNSVNTFARRTSVISLADTPKAKASPPLWPLVRLCLMTEKKIGPTDRLSRSPMVSPFAITSTITKYEV